MLTCGVVVGANKNRIVAIVDIPNEFIQTAAEDEKDREFILIHGPFADILVSTAPDTGPLINLGTQHDGRSARVWMKRV